MVASRVAVLAIIVALLGTALAAPTDDAYKRSALGTMRFGKRSPVVSEETEDEGVQRMTRSDSRFGTMRFGKRAHADAMEDDEGFYYIPKRAALGTMRFGRR